MRVVVRQDHIDRGVRRSGFSCPIALAISEKFPNADISVGGYSTWLWFGDHATRYWNSEAARHFVEQFDAGEPVKPATFILKG